jgi:TPR repeat protein
MDGPEARMIEPLPIFPTHRVAGVDDRSHVRATRRTRTSLICAVAVSLGMMLIPIAVGQPALSLQVDDQRLLASAERLLRQGDVGSARMVLQHAVDKGSARAAFKLAETYDGRMLRTWRTYGTQPDDEKARGLYARAAAAGIEAATERLQALTTGVSGGASRSRD